MIAAETFRGKKIALFGLGGSGLATALALIAGGAEVSAWDDMQGARDKANEKGVGLVDLHHADWSQFSSFVLTPGVPLTHPAPHWSVVLAQAAGVEIIGDVEIFCRERNACAIRPAFIAITGTNGKSTTTALTAHLFQSFGYQVEMGGNIGKPILSLASLSPERIYVIELSTFQIDLTPSLNPSIGLLLNLTPDHLDRHGDMTRYAAIKERLVAGSDAPVIALDDDFTRAIAERLKRAGKVVFAASSTSGDLARGIVVDGSRLLSKGADTSLIADLAGVASLRGRHNAQNAAMAVAAFFAQDFGAQHFEYEGVQKGLASFPGLAHRMEEVGRSGAVLFINDSKATNADAADKALSSFSDIFWIVGGVAKEGGIAPLQPLFHRIRKAYLIGQSSDAFAHTLAGHVDFARCGTLDVALEMAARDASESSASEPVVLLSPACASYDQFTNFERRGDAFRAQALALNARNIQAGASS